MSSNADPGGHPRGRRAARILLIVLLVIGLAAALRVSLSRPTDLERQVMGVWRHTDERGIPFSWDFSSDGEYVLLSHSLDAAGHIATTTEESSGTWRARDGALILFSDDRQEMWDRLEALVHGNRDAQVMEILELTEDRLVLRSPGGMVVEWSRLSRRDAR